MKKLFTVTIMMAVAIVGFSQEYIQQPTAINTWDYVYDYDAEFPFNKNITLHYDERGNLSYYYHVINYPGSPYTQVYWFTHDALNRLTYKQFYFQEGSSFGTKRYYYSYDESSNLTECLVMRLYKGDMYYTDEFTIESKDIYQYENGKKTRWDHLVDSTLTLQNYYLYDYSDNSDWSSEIKYKANGQPITKTEHTYSDNQEVLTDTKSNWSTESEAWIYSSHIEYTYSDTHQLLTRTAFSWSAETETWIISTLTEYEYDEGVLMEKRIKSWNNEEVNQQKQLYDYDESGNCTQILFQTMVDSVFADQNRAIYVYDENNLCTNAYAQRWNDTIWVLGGFPSGTYLFFDDIYDDVNDAIGPIAYCTRAEVTDYVTTPNPKYIMTPPDLEGEWYYEIQNDNGSITYQHLQSEGDTVVQGKRPKIIIRSNTQYDRDEITTTTHEYVYEEDGIVYWWNKDLEEFTVLYDLTANAGDEWEIKVGTESIIMHVDTVEYYEHNGYNYRMLRVSDVDDLFSGNIICSIGHMTSFFPERLMNRNDNYIVNGLRCYWVGDALLYHNGDEDCDAIYSELHGVDENGPSTGSGTEGALVVYPNPADDVIIVETRRATSLPAEQTYRITNLMGQTLLSGHVGTFHETSLQSIDVSNLPAGLYFINVGGQTVKFVKQ